MNLSDFSPAFQLLIILCKPEWSAFDLQYINEHRSIDQDLLLELANRHRVEPLLWSAQQKSQLFSASFSNTLRKIVTQNQIRALRSKALQASLLGLMQKKDISGFPLKGTSIAERFYHDLAERHVLDLDLWVGEDNIKLMTTELMSLGFQPSPNILNFNTAQWNYFKATHHDIYFSTTGDRYSPPIELHWRLRSSFGVFDFNPNGPMLLYDEFLYLCVHGTEHGWFRLKWLMDIPRIMLKTDIDWNKIMQRAVELKCLQHLEITLLVLDKLDIMPLPAAFGLLDNPAAHKCQLIYIAKAMRSASHFNETDQNRWNYFQFLWNLGNNKWNGKFIFNFLTSPNDWRLISLPSSLFFLYFLMRPFLWAFRRFSWNTYSNRNHASN